MIRLPNLTHRRYRGEEPITPVVDRAIPWPTGDGYLPASPAAEEVSRAERAQSFDSIYRACFVDVARWVRALGANDADVEDIAQEVFIIVRRKLAAFDGVNLRGFLYRIAQRTVRDHRRSAWFRHLFGKQSPFTELVSQAPTGLHLIQERERRKALEAILARMSEKRRTTFWLFEIEGY